MVMLALGFALLCSNFVLGFRYVVLWTDFLLSALNLLLALSLILRACKSAALGSLLRAWIFLCYNTIKIPQPIECQA